MLNETEAEEIDKDNLLAYQTDPVVAAHYNKAGVYAGQPYGGYGAYPKAPVPQPPMGYPRHYGQQGAYGRRPSYGQVPLNYASPRSPRRSVSPGADLEGLSIRGGPVGAVATQDQQDPIYAHIDPISVSF